MHMAVKLTFILLLFCHHICICLSRSALARDDLCKRFHTMAACKAADATFDKHKTEAIPAEKKTVIVSGRKALSTQNYCMDYQTHFVYYCKGNIASSTTDDIRSFCDAYNKFCNIGNVPTSDAASLNSEAAQQQVSQMCSNYQHLASRFCTGKEIGRVKQLCNLYRTYCLRNQEEAPTALPLSAGTGIFQSVKSTDEAMYCSRNSQAYVQYCFQRPAGKTVQFCKTYAQKCPLPKEGTQMLREGEPSSVLTSGNLFLQPGIDISLLCSQYRLIAERICTGYETQNVRQYCNLYRVYCLNQRPFPIIDGNIGVTTDAWGVSGIPFYPFNPQGAIGGGRRVGIGFGDWGARVSEQRGVSDFWDQGRVINANWQRGIYGPTRGWGVPLVGIGGFRSNVVKLGGLAAPADWAALRSGGVPPPTLGMVRPGFLPFSGPTAVGASSPTSLSPLGQGPQDASLTSMSGQGMTGLGQGIGFGQSTGIGIGNTPIFGTSSGTSINPLGGITSGRGWNAAGIRGFSGTGVDFSGLPFLRNIG
ncbi:hypothetical protein T4B_6347 [Trichinella pseudospiralis]|uniref:Uncharacterized protein n=1 Tax=Trichinella pseudospiralis TaxID=6337 RepID=A0A0V1E5E3_TRIPS|nr:hypothetical protein T4A_7106 [Trichinella pseudospiralis]KRZ24921.1 hypothetical protein T4B_6347 [Trichinella pseudospiralis]KRZ37857.1 hypothetical protein T4C_12205 [Trichinella pseudospiralis]